MNEHAFVNYSRKFSDTGMHVCVCLCVRACACVRARARDVVIKKKTGEAHEL